MAFRSGSGGVGSDRDTFETTLMLVSYLKEAVDILAPSERLWELIEMAV